MTPPLPFDATAGANHLALRDPVLASVISRVGPCIAIPPPQIDLFQALLRSIIYQQLHGRAAAAIHSRVLALMPEKQIRAEALAAISDASLRDAGLSANKLRAVRDLSLKVLDGTVPPSGAVEGMGDDELVARLTVVRGIGPWTVQMLMIFHLGRPDVMPAGDFAIRKAFSLLYRGGRAVRPEVILRHARRWQPYRSVASWYLYRSLDTALS